jgi:predicted amidohydrolase
MKLFILISIASMLLIKAYSNDEKNLISNGNFSKGEQGKMPDGWSLETKHPEEAPLFTRIEENGKGRLLIEAVGRPDIVGGIKTAVHVAFGKTYLFSVRFRVSPEVDPHRNLLFQCYGPRNFDGIFEFIKKEGGWIEGSSKLFFPGEGSGIADVKILFRFCEKGKVMVSNISLTESHPDQPRWVRVACTSGFTNLQNIRSIARQAAIEKTDLLLLPEFMNGPGSVETLAGPSCELMSQLSQEYKMYIAGGILRRDAEKNRVYNTAVLYDRGGRLIAAYDKIHPSSPEVNEMGVTPGNKVVVVQTDFGKVGFMTCYDSWFTDVIELNALKGAELILFPSAGYYRSIMTARAADNGVRILASSLYNKGGIWDTGGRDLQNPDQDTTAMLMPGETFRGLTWTKIDSVSVLTGSLDFNFSPQPHYNNGYMFSAPAGRRNKRDQLYYLDDDIKNERNRWWKE